MIPVFEELKPEIPSHLETIDTLVSTVQNGSFPTSLKGVTGRFLRDCEVLRSDLNTVDRPTTEDMVDFCDRVSSLSIQCEELRSACVDNHTT